MTPPTPHAAGNRRGQYQPHQGHTAVSRLSEVRAVRGGSGLQHDTCNRAQNEKPSTTGLAVDAHAVVQACALAYYLLCVNCAVHSVLVPRERGRAGTAKAGKASERVCYPTIDQPTLADTVSLQFTVYSSSGSMCVWSEPEA